MPSEVNVDAITCPTRFTSVKGKLDASTNSYYPPRNDLTKFGNGDCDAVGGTLPGCTVSAMTYAALNDLDAVAAATPAYGAPYTGTWTIPAALPAGDYALYVEVNKEFDTNPSHSHPSYEDPQLKGSASHGDSSRPSVVYRVPIHIDSAAGVPRARPCRRSTATATGPARTARSSAGRDDLDGESRLGEARLLERTATTGPRAGARQIEPCGSTTCAPPPPSPDTVTGLAADRERARRHLGRVDVQECAGERWRRQELRDPLREGATMSDAGVSQAVRAPVVDAGAPGASASVTISGLKPATDYVAGVRAADACGQNSAIAPCPSPPPRRSSSRSRAASSRPRPGARRWPPRSRRCGGPATVCGPRSVMAATARTSIIARGPPRPHWFAAATPPVAAVRERYFRPSQRLRRCFTARMRPLMRARSLLLGGRFHRWWRVRRGRPTNARSSLTSSRPNAPRSRSGSKSADGTFLARSG